MFKLLSRALKIPENKIRSALDASRRLFTPTEHPMPHQAFDVSVGTLRSLENDKRNTISRTYVLNIAKSLHLGATAK